MDNSVAIAGGEGHVEEGVKGVNGAGQCRLDLGW